MNIVEMMMTIKQLLTDYENFKLLTTEDSSCSDQCIDAYLEQNNINLLEKHLTEFSEWLDDNHTSFKIPDMILQDYIQTSKL